MEHLSCFPRVFHYIYSCTVACKLHIWPFPWLWESRRIDTVTGCIVASPPCLQNLINEQQELQWPSSFSWFDVHRQAACWFGFECSHIACPCASSSQQLHAITLGLFFLVYIAMGYYSHYQKHIWDKVSFDCCPFIWFVSKTAARYHLLETRDLQVGVQLW